MLKLNETPVRTARNFNINNIKIDEADVIYKNQGFDNIEINGIDIDYVSDDVSKCDLVYGSEIALAVSESNIQNSFSLPFAFLLPFLKSIVPLKCFLALSFKAPCTSISISDFSPLNSPI